MASSMRTAAVLLGTVVGAAAPASAQIAPPEPGPEPDPRLELRVEESNYRIHGRTAEELENSMYREGPDVGDRVAYGRTTATIRRRYHPEWTGEACRLADVRVQLTMVVHLPRWTPPEGVAPELKRDWDTFLTALRRHEYGHRDIGVEMGNAVVRALEQVRVESCGELAGAAEAAAQAVIAEYGRKQRAYDRDPRYSPPEIEWPPGL